MIATNKCKMPNSNTTFLIKIDYRGDSGVSVSALVEENDSARKIGNSSPIFRRFTVFL